MNWRQPVFSVASVKAVQTVTVPPRTKLGSSAGHRICGLPLALAKVSAWCQSVPSSPGYLAKNSVRQQSTLSPMMDATRSTILALQTWSVRKSMSRCRS
jgi:hypothetical protein